MKFISCVLLLVIFFFPFSHVHAQQANPNDNRDDGSPNPHFASMTKELGFICGEFLPNQIPGVTEIMPLCGGRAGFKIGPKTTLEPMLVTGAAKGQRYILGSTNLRGDIQIDDIVSSFYIGADIHFATQPIYDAFGNAVDSQTNIYFGGHIGGAVWFELIDDVYFRTDLQFNLNPGTSLFVNFGLTWRFDPGGGGAGNPTP